MMIDADELDPDRGDELRIDSAVVAAKCAGKSSCVLVLMCWLLLLAAVGGCIAVGAAVGEGMWAFLFPCPRRADNLDMSGGKAGGRAKGSRLRTLEPKWLRNVYI